MLLIEQALRFAFKASNNQVEYEAFTAGMLLAKEMGTKSFIAKSDSLLVTGQVTGDPEDTSNHHKRRNGSSSDKHLERC